MQVDLALEFCAAYPQGLFGVLIVCGCPNRPQPLALGPHTRAIESRLRERFGSGTIDADPVAQAYAGYFRRFGTRYPVVHQAKTVLSGRPIESASALVHVMFAAELDSLVLTSGHDLDTLTGPLLVDVARDGETYTKISGKEQRLQAGDMVVRDGEGIIASVVYGPDFRTRMRPESSAVLFGAWGPVGLTPEVVVVHLDQLAGLLREEWPDAAVEPPRCYSPSGPAPS